MQFLDVIKQRKTIKAFDPNYTLSQAELSELLTAATLAPSKANLQPWRFVVLTEQEQKAKLVDKVAFNALPCETASAVILILADLHYEQLLPTILDHSIAQGCLAPQFRENSLNFLQGVHQSLTEQEIRDQVLIDTSLAAMQLMLAVKDKGLDSHAIGIFDRQAVLDALGVDSQRYAPVMLLAIGKAAVEPVPSVRLPLNYTVAWNSGAFHYPNEK